MSVQKVLSRKGTTVYTVEPTATVAYAVKVLTEQGIGALVVTGAEGRTVGIVSERDIVRSINSHGAAVLDIQVSEIMTRKVATCTRQDKIADLMEQMTEGHFRHVPVVEDGRLLGIVSIGDVVKSRIEQVEQESHELREYIRSA